MTRKARLLAQLAGDDIDRVPIVGGWSLGARNLAALGGMTVEAYLTDPLAHVIAANRRQGVDGMVPPIIPQDVDAIRAGSLQEEGFTELEPEAILHRAEAIPDSADEILRTRFDAAAVDAEFREHFSRMTGAMDDIALVPTIWAAPANFSLYFTYGYVAFLSAVALYPEAVARIYWEDGILSRERNHHIIRLWKEFDLIPLLFTGDDICTNDGPMVQPAFLRDAYWPHVARALEPYREAGIRCIHHCDGNVMPLVDDMVAAGFTGFQGFQYECGVDIYDLRTRRGPDGEEMLIMGGLSVTRTLPFGTPDDVRREVDYCLDATDGGRGF
ncbi:MAG TPA: uroporphyrinogen decarboxylase family protein, partial [Armatimonadota bacterium]|nr:uroporphyrinogen decarboxylase family protein [Armatimonadota bacterium]